MTITGGVIVISALVFTVLLGWYFFGPKKSRRATLEDGVQVVRVMVKGGYSPDLIEVQPGVPVRLLFDRQETGDCSSRVVMADFKINELLPAYATTAIDFVPQDEGDYRFACGMNMISGTVRVAAGTTTAPAGPSAAAGVVTVTAPERHAPGRHGDADRAVEPSTAATGGPVTDDAEAGERAAEIKDLTRRVVFGSILTAPVLVAVMFTEFFKVTWMPELLLNHWFQLVLIAPVMLYTGWPIHRTGWLALSHRTADMNALITLGTFAAFGYSLVVTFVPGILPQNVREVYYEAVGVIITLILLGR